MTISSANLKCSENAIVVGPRLAAKNEKSSSIGRAGGRGIPSGIYDPLPIICRQYLLGSLHDTKDK